MPCSVIEQSGGGREEEKTIVLQISRGIANLRDVCVCVCACVCVCVCVQALSHLWHWQADSLPLHHLEEMY